jgi:hypothetical protein
LILDTSVLTAVARGDADIIALVQEYDARGQPPDSTRRSA